jgi:hypothetical protein
MLDLDFRLQNFSLGLAYDKKYGCTKNLLESNVYNHQVIALRMNQSDA